MRALAERQGGILTVAELRACGVPDTTIQRAAATGRLQRQSRGIYRLGPMPRQLAERSWCALRAVGPNATVSRITAATLCGLVVDAEADLPSEACGPIHVTVVGGGRRRPAPGIRVHRCRAAPSGTVEVGRLRVTDVPWTLLDLAGELPASRLLDACRRAVSDLGTDPHRIRMVAERSPRPGSARLRWAVRTVGAPALLRSGGGLPAKLIALLHAAGIPEPAVEVPVCGFRVDLLWESARLIVEADGRRGHDGDDRQRADAVRDARLRAAGYTVLRVRTEDLRRRGTWIVETVRAHVAASR